MCARSLSLEDSTKKVRKSARRDERRTLVIFERHGELASSYIERGSWDRRAFFDGMMNGFVLIIFGRYGASLRGMQ